MCGIAILTQLREWTLQLLSFSPKGRLDYYTKKLALRGTRPSPHFAQDGSITPKISWTLSPLDLSTYTEFGPDRLGFPALILERLIFRPKKPIQYRLSAYNHTTCSCESRSQINGYRGSTKKFVINRRLIRKFAQHCLQHQYNLQAQPPLGPKKTALPVLMLDTQKPAIQDVSKK